MRTTEEILYRLAHYDGFFCAGDLVSFLPYEEAKKYLKEGVTAEKFCEICETPEQAIKGYIPFALEKAEGHRGISAGRSVEHFDNWIWMTGDEELYRQFNDAGYAMYGCPQLKVVLENISMSGAMVLQMKTLST